MAKQGVFFEADNNAELPEILKNARAHKQAQPKTPVSIVMRGKSVELTDHITTAEELNAALTRAGTTSHRQGIAF